MAKPLLHICRTANTSFTKPLSNETAYWLEVLFKTNYIDKAYYDALFLDKFKVSFGDGFDYVSEQKKLIFSQNEEWGVNLLSDYAGNFSYRGKLNESAVIGLPSFDAEAVKEAYPEAAEHIDAIIEGNNNLAEDVLDSGKSLLTYSVVENKGNVTESYRELCDIMGMEMIIVS